MSRVYDLLLPVWSSLLYSLFSAVLWVPYLLIFSRSKKRLQANCLPLILGAQIGEFHTNSAQHKSVPHILGLILSVFTLYRAHAKLHGVGKMQIKSFLILVFFGWLGAWTYWLFALVSAGLPNGDISLSQRSILSRLGWMDILDEIERRRSEELALFQAQKEFWATKS